MILRSTGTVTEVGAREGVAKSTGKPYSIPFAVITLNDFVHTTVNLVDSLVGKLSTGDVVDLIVDVESQGGYLRAVAQGYWPTEGASSHRARPLASASS